MVSKPYRYARKSSLRRTSQTSSSKFQNLIGMLGRGAMLIPVFEFLIRFKTLQVCQEVRCEIIYDFETHTCFKTLQVCQEEEFFNQITVHVMSFKTLQVCQEGFAGITVIKGPACFKTLQVCQEGYIEEIAYAEFTPFQNLIGMLGRDQR